MEDLMLEAFKIISEAGNASALFLKAVAAAENECFDEAAAQLQTGNDSLVTAHRLQTQLLQNEASGCVSEYSLIMVHAQDHLMNAILMKDMANSIIKLNQKVASMK
ncbi:PTS lactose/cellobiose transporter subunit IIA [[Clostridium] innocuum]